MSRRIPSPQTSICLLTTQRGILLLQLSMAISYKHRVCITCKFVTLVLVHPYMDMVFMRSSR